LTVTWANAGLLSSLRAGAEGGADLGDQCIEPCRDPLGINIPPGIGGRVRWQRPAGQGCDPFQRFLKPEGGFGRIVTVSQTRLRPLR
jgi:hypothetical protein